MSLLPVADQIEEEVASPTDTASRNAKFRDGNRCTTPPKKIPRQLNAGGPRSVQCGSTRSSWSICRSGQSERGAVIVTGDPELYAAREERIVFVA